jgi:hypothetical protein
MKLKGFKKPREIIDFIGVKQRTYYTWRNRREIPPKDLMEIADKIGIPIKNLIQNEDINEPKKDYRIEDIVNLLKDDPEGTEAVFHFLEAKKNFDRASKAMKQYLGKKLEVWFEFPSSGDGDSKKDSKD